MDIEEQIKNISAQIDARLDEIEKLVVSIVETKEKIIKLEISILNDRITQIEQNRDDINYMSTELFS